VNSHNSSSDLLLARAEAEKDRFLRLKLRGSDECAGDDEGHRDDAHRQSELHKHHDMRLMSFL
jgi:hypothetical protein